jgi:hypothetical protein
MKTQSITTISFISIFLLFGCGKEGVNPVASFTISKSTVEVGETVSFSNMSENSTEYSWDFGDGNTSDEVNPTNTYEEIGTYTVTLTAYENGNSNSSTKTIEVVPALLNIEPGVRVGDFYLTDDLDTHFTKLDESKMVYSSILLTTDEHLHIFTFDYAGIKFYIYSPTEDYTTNDVPEDIQVYSPFEGQAKGGISFGSSFEDVVNVFGEPLVVFSNGDHLYNNIIFYADNTGLSVKRITIR